MNRKFFLFFAGLLVVLNVFVWGEVFVLAEPKYLEVSFLDVGQGDSAFIETPQGHQILIDGGPSSRVLEGLNKTMPFWDRSIDLVILTHPEKDHMQGLFDVLQRYKVDYFLWTGVEKEAGENLKLAKILNELQGHNESFLASVSRKGTKAITADAGKYIKAGNVLINILYPFENLAGQQPKNLNETSVVSRLVFGENEFIFVGDIGFSTEKLLNNSYAQEDLRADVLKVGHHGSKYSTSDLLLQNVRPDVAVISVGKNSYGHPTPEVLQRLDNFGIKVLRTDTQGDIRIVSDGKNIKLINN